MLVRPLPSCSRLLFLSRHFCRHSMSLRPKATMPCLLYRTSLKAEVESAVSTQLKLGTLAQVCEAPVGGERRLLHRQPAARGAEPGGRPAEARPRGPQAHPHRPRLPALLRWALTADTLGLQSCALDPLQSQAGKAGCFNAQTVCRWPRQQQRCRRNPTYTDQHPGKPNVHRISVGMRPRRCRCSSQLERLEPGLLKGAWSPVSGWRILFGRQRA